MGVLIYTIGCLIRNNAPKNMPFRLLFVLAAFSFMEVHGTEDANGTRHPRFLGSGYIALPVMQSASNRFGGRLIFRPDFYNGLILFSGDLANASSDFFSLFLDDGYLTFRFDCGSGIGELRIPQRVALGTENDLFFARLRGSIIMNLNGGAMLSGYSPGTYNQIAFHINLYLGGYTDMETIAHRVGTRYKYDGCVRSLVINSHTYSFKSISSGGDVEFESNVGDCALSLCDQDSCNNAGECVDAGGNISCLCPYSYTGNSCENSVNILRRPSFSNQSFIVFPTLQNVQNELNITLTIRPMRYDGLLLLSSFYLFDALDLISLTLVNGHVTFRFDSGSGVGEVRTPNTVTLNASNTIYIKRVGKRASIKLGSNGTEVTGVSPGTHSQMSFHTYLYLGGYYYLEEIAERVGNTDQFRGCVYELRINQHNYDLHSGSLDIVNEDNIGDCDTIITQDEWLAEEGRA